MLEEKRKLKNWVGKAHGRKIQIERIPGDASTRHYYRVHASADDGISTMIAMKMESFVEKGESLPFIQVQKYLSSLSLPVPSIVEFSPEDGYILLSDLGDQTLLKELQSISDHGQELELFQKAIDLVIDLHAKTYQQKSDIDAFGLYFDEEKLMWEVNFTLTHFYKGQLAREISEDEHEKIRAFFKIICRRLASQSWVFTHRDYHSRNIMVNEGEYYLIDFQDARLGCPQYDLASLLRDSYYMLPEESIYQLVKYYYTEMKRRTDIELGSLTEFVEIFDLMSIQRNFKAIGSFASFFNKRTDVRYVKFIGNTFENIRRNLMKFPELEELRQILFKNYYF